MKPIKNTYNLLFNSNIAAQIQRPYHWLMVLACCSFFAKAAGQSTQKAVDTVQSPVAVKPKIPTFTHFRVGIDLSKFVASALQKNYDVIEGNLETHYKKDIYYAAEFGWGSSEVNNDYLNYKSSNIFLKAGIDKTFFTPEFAGDLDNAFIGVRYGAAYIRRGAGTYHIEDPVWGNTEGQVDATSFFAHWLELDAGFRIEILKNVFTGWNARFRTFINPSQFEQLPPSYVAGYGRGDKNTAFGYNFYLMYGFGKR